ncbi:MAG: hypothetical protein ACRDJW_15855 [Thermomicrobiales bacterium]
MSSEQGALIYHEVKATQPNYALWLVIAGGLILLFFMATRRRSR